MSSTTVSDPRNVLRGPGRERFVAWVVAVTVAGAVVLALTLPSLPYDRFGTLPPTFWMVAGLLLFGELRPLLTAGAKDDLGVAISTSFVFALLLRYGLATALLAQVLATLASDISKRRAVWRTAFNGAQYTLSWAGAGLVLSWLGHAPDPRSPALLHTPALLAAVGAAGMYFLVNQSVVTIALSLRSGEPVWSIWREEAPYELFTNGTLLAIGPLVVLTMERGVAFVPLLVPPLAVVYAVAHVALTREQQALSDALTGLPNRVLLARRADAALREGMTGLLLFDLDRFKEVNDTLGHHVGDRLLRVVAQRLDSAVRPGDTVARLGGDEFALVLPALSSAREACEAAGRIRALLTEPIVLEGLLVDVGASVGVAVSPEHGDDVEVLLQHADVAMYLSKESGDVELYAPERDSNSTRRLVVLGELRRALEQGELELHYQPKADLETGRVVGVEALVRWRHPVRGLVPPDEFVPLAERSGLIQPLTSWVLDAGLAQLARWRAEGLMLTLAVNVSVRDLCGAALADHVTACLDRYAVPAASLLLEVTEGSLFADPVRAAPTLRRLDALGVTLSLDDFGTGYSSLGHLRRLPVQEIKIDKSFVQRMEGDPRDLAIVRSIIDLGGGLGMNVVAEGVETASVWRRLQLMGCSTAQGWFLSRPEPADVLTPWLRERAAPVRRVSA